MKAICIDNKDGIWKLASLLLEEGKTYTVYDCGDKECYRVDGLLFDPRDGAELLFFRKRFAPLSDIDEMELINEKELSLTL